MTPEQRIELIVAASASALLASIVLLLRGAGRRVPGCGAGSGCDAVTASRWAKIGPLPVALPGAVVYAGMLACAIAFLLIPDHELKLPIARTLVGLGALAAGSAIWFLFLQLLVLRRFCFYCVAAHLGALAAGAAILPDVAPPHRWDNPLTPGAVLGLAVLVLFILLQLTIRPRLHRIAPPEEVMEEPVTLEAAVVAPEPEAAPQPELPPPQPAIEVSTPPPSPPAPVRASRQITLLGGRLHFDSSIFPILGPPDAKFLIATMMDYTCEFCRRLHPMLDEAIRAFNGELATLMVFSPLEPACNPLVEEFEPSHVNACAYARLAMALASLDEAKFVPFHRWLFEGDRPPPTDQAEARAGEWVGTQALRETLGGARVKQRLNDGLTLYRITGKGPLPRVLLPTGVLMGEVSDSGYLIKLLREQLSAAPMPAGRAGPQAAKPSPFSDRAIG